MDKEKRRDCNFHKGGVSSEDINSRMGSSVRSATAGSSGREFGRKTVQQEE